MIKFAMNSVITACCVAIAILVPSAISTIIASICCVSFFALIVLYSAYAKCEGISFFEAAERLDRP